MTEQATMERFRVEQEIPSPGGAPEGLAYDGRHLWVSDPAESRIYKIDPETSQVVLTIPFDGDVAGTAWDGSHLWQVDNRSKTVSQIDPESGSIVVALACDPGPGRLAGLCFDGEDLWLAVTGTEQLRRIRAKDGAIVKVHAVKKDIGGVGYDRRRIWYSETASDVVRLMDPATGTELMSYHLTGRPTGIAFVERRTFWFGEAEGKRLMKVTLLPRS